MNRKTLLALALIIFILTTSFYAFKNRTFSPEKTNDIAASSPGNLSRVRVVSMYESVTDRYRDIDSAANLFADTKTEYIHRGFYRHTSNFELKSPTERRSPDVYEVLKSYIATIKNKNPGIIFGAAIPAQQISAVEHDPVTDEIIPREKTWEMVIDPQKYGLDMTKEEAQKKYSENAGTDMYFPDITNPDFQKLFLDITKKEIDSGADAIWIDGLFAQANALTRLSGDRNNPGVRSAYEASSTIVDEIHKYGNSKGKYIYVGSWDTTDFPYPAPKLDYVTAWISQEEIRNKKPDEAKWNEEKRRVREKYGDVPVIAVIDWAFHTDTPLGVFSQSMSKDEAGQVLRNFDSYFKENGILFAYPLHGGFMGWEATRLSSGKSKTYDSLAPEFDTYETIRELSQKKAEGE
ncbi:Uncharacterised protein [uncultured archaeon]|nr:Uncharacterised protein [uncultured archaeon]